MSIKGIQLVADVLTKLEQAELKLVKIASKNIMKKHKNAQEIAFQDMRLAKLVKQAHEAVKDNFAREQMS